MKLSVIVPTYRRPQDLARCLQAFEAQLRPADELLITVRDTDQLTWKFLETYLPISTLPLKILTVKKPGVIAAMNAGILTTQGDIISVTDDDAAPHSDWLQRIEAHFTANEHLGGLGGRDWNYINGQLQDASHGAGTSIVVGKIQWFGRMIGNHDIGSGEARPVDILKGVNMSFRRTALEGIACDSRLLGQGAQVHFEAALSLAVKHRNWELIYDPNVAVDHFPSQRFDEDKRDAAFSYSASKNIAHNETLILLEHLAAIQRLVYLCWAIFIGTRGTPGFLQVVRLFPKEGEEIFQKWHSSLVGRWAGYRTWRQQGNGVKRCTDSSSTERAIKS